MSNGSTPMRRRERQITETVEIEAVLTRAKVCRLAMVDGMQPYMVPLCFGYWENSLYLHSAADGRKIDLLRKNPRVCFEVDEVGAIRTAEAACNWSMTYASVIGWGTAVFLVDSEDIRRALEIICRHYGAQESAFTATSLKRIVVLRIDIQTITGKRSA